MRAFLASFRLRVAALVLAAVAAASSLVCLTAIPQMRTGLQDSAYRAGMTFAEQTLGGTMASWHRGVRTAEGLLDTSVDPASPHYVAIRIERPSATGFTLVDEAYSQEPWPIGPCGEDASYGVYQVICKAPPHTSLYLAAAQVDVGAGETPTRLVVVISQDTSVIDEVLGSATRQLWRSAALATGVSGVLAWLVAGFAVRPVRRMSQAARAIAGGDLEKRVAVQGSDALASLGRDVNLMADSLTSRIEEARLAEAQQRQVVSDISHELRTPAAALLAGATALENPATRDEAARLLPEQMRRLASLTEEVLELSRFDAGRQQLSLDRIDLQALVAQAVAGAPVPVSHAASGDTSAVIEARRVSLILRNLLLNAAKHGAPPVRCTVDGLPDSIVVTVTDDGQGVPDSLRRTVFDRFVQGDASRSGGGSGLGLSLARENARLHGGDLTLDDDGRTFRLTLPREQPAHDGRTLVTLP